MMWTKDGLVAAVVLLTTLLHSTIAVQCGNGTTDILAASQEELDSDLAGCTSWDGGIRIAYGWSGPFVLNNITNITTYLQGDIRSTEDLKSPLVTSIEAPELRFAGQVSLGNMHSLAAISLPKLERVVSLRLDQHIQNGVTADFSALAQVTGYIEMFGNIPRVSFPSLVEVAGEIYIASNRSLLYQYPLDTSASFPGINVDFPVLERAALIHMLGNISSIDMPSLVSSSGGLDRSSSYNDWYLKIWTSGDPLGVKFPSLWNISDISLSGTVSSFSFPALKSLNGTFKFEPSNNATFDVRPLQRATEVVVMGNVTSYNLDSLTSVNKLNIYPDRNIDCEPAAETWKRMYPSYGTESWFQKNEYWTYSYSCNGLLLPTKEKRPFPKVAVGLSVGIGIPVWLFFMFALWHSRKEKKKAEEVAKIPPPDYEAEMAARSPGGGEVLPDYEPRRSQGSGSHPGSVIELVDMTRPSPHPPGYEAAIGNVNEAGSTTTGPGEVRNGRVLGDDEPRAGARS